MRRLIKYVSIMCNGVATLATSMAIGILHAEIVNVTDGSTSGYTMTDGNTYVAQNSVTFSNATAGCRGMSLEDSVIVALQVPHGITLTAMQLMSEVEKVVGNSLRSVCQIDLEVLSDDYVRTGK